MDGVAEAVEDCVRRALVEDLGQADLGLNGDVTATLALADPRRGRARMIARSSGVLAGLDCAVVAFTLLDPAGSVAPQARDGDALSAGNPVLTVEAGMRALLAAERTALNFVQRLSGVATMTRSFVDAVAGTGARILDTRKTTPGLRLLQKRAVVAGGGENHRFGLHDQVLLKENHFALAAPAAYEDVVRRCTTHPAGVVAEARDVEEAVAAVRGGAAVVLLDNFRPGASLRAAVDAVQQAARAEGRRVETEASGGIDLGSVRAFAESGVDRISVGAVTHSAPALDMSLLVEGVAA